MTKTEYLHQLERYLKRLPKADYENAIEHFTEYFEDAGIGEEQKVIEELGTPKEAAAELLKNLLKEDLKNTKKETFDKETPKTIGRKVWIACLSIMAAPIAIPLALTAVVFLLAMGLCLCCLLLMIGLLSFSMALMGAKLLLRGIIAIPYSLSGAGMITGMGLFGVGLAILFSILTIFFYQWIKWIFWHFTQKIAGIKKNQSML